MSMTDVFRSLGKADALKLREEAKNMTGTQVIEEEHAVPAFDPKKNSPVADEGQVWLLIQPHDAANYEGRPSTLRALWGIAHTKDYKRAKLWVNAFGTSGMYMKDEVYKETDGTVYRAKNDNTVHNAMEYPTGWDKLDKNGEVVML